MTPSRASERAIRGADILRGISRSRRATSDHESLLLTIDGIRDLTDEVLRDLRSSVLHIGEQCGWRGRVQHMHPHGWKSDMRILREDLPGCRKTLAGLSGFLGIDPERIQDWAMVNRAGAMHREHTHAGVDVSGVLYLDDAITPTYFNLSRAGERIIVPAVRGRLALFAGSVPHRVPTVRTTPDRPERVTLAFNVLD